MAFVAYYKYICMYCLTELLYVLRKMPLKTQTFKNLLCFFSTHRIIYYTCTFGFESVQVAN